MKLKIACPVSDTTKVHCRSRPSIVVLSIGSFLLLLFLNIVYFSVGAIIRWNAFCKFSLNILTTNIDMVYNGTGLGRIMVSKPYFLFLRIGQIQSETGCILLMLISKLTYVNLF